MPIYQDTLRAARATVLKSNARSLNEARMFGIKSAFLCHSHRDRDLAEGLVSLLTDRGLQLYVDWADSDMPEQPNAETAARIKNKIKELDLFFVLATANSLASRWCPWELGYADGVKAWERIIIVPTAERSGPIYGNEYIQLYRQLEPTNTNDVGVFNPGLKDGRLVRSL